MRTREREIEWLARRLLDLNNKPYDPETCDKDSADFEKTALALADTVLDSSSKRKARTK